MKATKIAKYLLTIFLFVIGYVTSSKAQYPFEKYKAINYTKLAFKVSYLEDTKTTRDIVYAKANLPGICKDNSRYSIFIKSYILKKTDDAIAIIYLKKDGKVFQKIIDKGFYLGGNALENIYIGDINGDSLPDIKFTCSNVSGAGLGSAWQRRIYLFQQPNGKFRKIAYKDFYISGKSPLNDLNERSFDSDNSYKIITNQLVEYRGHNYWTFDLYEYKNGELNCVDDKYDYPIMVEYLYRENYEVTKKIFAEKMKTFKKEKPDEYDSR